MDGRARPVILPDDIPSTGGGGWVCGVVIHAGCQLGGRAMCAQYQVESKDLKFAHVRVASIAGLLAQLGKLGTFDAVDVQRPEWEPVCHQPLV